MTDTPGHAWETILALAAALQALTLGVLRYLTKQIDRRDRQLRDANDALIESAHANARIASLVPSLVDEIESLKSTARKD